MEMNFLPVQKCRDCEFEFYKEQAGPRRHTKNLDEVARQYEFNKNQKLDVELDVLSMTIDKEYISKAGNRCWFIQYTTMQGIVKEWLKAGTYFQREFQRDFKLMGNPKKIITEKKGKWFNVKERKWT